MRNQTNLTVNKKKSWECEGLCLHLVRCFILSCKSLSKVKLDTLDTDEHQWCYDSPRQTCCVKWITDPNSFIPFFSGKMKSCSSSSWLILSSWFSIFPIVVIVRGNVIDINVYLPGSGQRWRWSSHISCLLEILHTQDALKYSFIGYCLH